MPSHSRKTILLATDQQSSVLNALDANQPHPIAYAAYGHRPRDNGLLRLLGFNGELPDPLTGHYHLGKGYRQFNPVLMRFNSPDSWSPFGKGGLNAYMYCTGDPVNRADPTGHMFTSLFKARRTPSPPRKAPAAPTAASSSSRGAKVAVPDKNQKLVDIHKADNGNRRLVYQLANGEERIVFTKKTKATETMLKRWEKDPSLKPTRRPVPKRSNVDQKVLSGSLDIDLRAPVVPGSDSAFKNEML